MSNLGLSEKNEDVLRDFFSKFSEITEVKVYGSRALGTFREGSDIDFALYGTLDKSLITKISYEIDELNIPYMFDITNYSTIENQKLKEHIDKYGKSFYLKM